MQVNLHECQPVLQLLAESFGVRQLSFEVEESLTMQTLALHENPGDDSGTGHFRDPGHAKPFKAMTSANRVNREAPRPYMGPNSARSLAAVKTASATSDNHEGFRLCLPESVNLFAETAENFGYYKVCLMHQLGYFEFGCCDSLARVQEACQSKPDPQLAERLFVIAEDARIDWQLARHFRGLASQLSSQKLIALQQRPAKPGNSLMANCLEYLLRLSLDAAEPRRGLILDQTSLSNSQSASGQQPASQANQPVQAATGQSSQSALPVSSQPATSQPAIRMSAQLDAIIAPLREASAGVDASLEAMASLYELLESLASGYLVDQLNADDDLACQNDKPQAQPEPVAFRGELDLDQVRSALLNDSRFQVLPDKAIEAIDAQTPQHQQDEPVASAQLDPQDIDKIEAGKLGEGASMMAEPPQHQANQLTEQAAAQEANQQPGLQAVKVKAASRQGADGQVHLYDEWDHEIADYRPGWCSLHELRELPRDENYVPRTLQEHQALLRRVRRQLSHLKPEMLIKVKGSMQGEELDLDNAINYLVDKRAGLTPDANIYIERQRAARDVSTLFLLDMSASTDDIIPDPAKEPPPPGDEDDDQQLFDYFEARRHYEKNARRIIDLEKQSVALMAEALEALGDSYAICGFSGYGREQVDYFLCKDFDQPWDASTQARLGGIKPHRSTRMGAPIRHATRSLLATGSRVRALIIISDGYPQDHDYGGDRNNRSYGLHDTMMAMMEARQQGILAWCLTVDPSGHDYLRLLCPDHQYAVMQELDQLPEQLSRVYYSLTG